MEEDLLRALDKLTKPGYCEIDKVGEVISLRGAMDRTKELKVIYAAQQAQMEKLLLEIHLKHNPNWIWPWDASKASLK